MWRTTEVHGSSPAGEIPCKRAACTPYSRRHIEPEGGDTRPPRMTCSRPRTRMGIHDEEPAASPHPLAAGPPGGAVALSRPGAPCAGTTGRKSFEEYHDTQRVLRLQ